MSTISKDEARNLIEQTFADFISFLRRNKKAFSNPSMPYAFRALIMDLPEWASAENPDDMDYLFEDLSAESYNYLLEQCFKLANGYRLSTRDRLAGATVENEPQESKTVKKLMDNVRGFGDEELSKRLAEVESGQSQIVFEEMKGGREGHTVFENGHVTYRLNKKYEKASDEADVCRASIILAHELQRNPEAGDLKGETTETVLRDMAFVERLAMTHGKKIYEQIPELGVLHYVKELFGEESVKEFAGIAFSNTGSYWELTEDGSLKDNETNNVRDREGRVLDEGNGRQKVLEKWLGLSDVEVWQHLLKPAGYKFDAETRQWSNAHGIPRAIIDKAYKDGILPADKYALITAGSNLQSQEAVDSYQAQKKKTRKD